MAEQKQQQNKAERGGTRPTQQCKRELGQNHERNVNPYALNYVGKTMLYSSFCLVYYYMLYIVGDVTELVGYGCDRAVTNLEMMNRNEKGWNLVLIW